jgi:hypothetical protein
MPSAPGPKRRSARPRIGSQPRIEAADAIYAAENWVFAAPQNDDSPMPQFRVGFDSHGRPLELVVLVFDSGNQMLIHAMKARKQYLKLLP